MNSESIKRNQSGDISERIVYDSAKNICYIEIYENGMLHMLCNYKNNALHGPSITYNASGYPISRSNFYEGKLHGPSFTYHENGAISMSCLYISGIMEGPSIVYYESGAIFEHGQYHCGKKEGEFIQNAPDGSTSVTKYAGGVQIPN